MAAREWPGLPDQVTSREVVVGDLNTHILECLPLVDHPFLRNAGDTKGKPPLVILLHGFPELAYSWRKIFIPLAQDGYYVVAPDQRGYGLTTLVQQGGPAAKRAPKRVEYGDDLRPYHIVNLAGDVINLIYALGYEEAHAVVGHDFGSSVAAWSALIRPDVVKRLVLMSAPFSGPPKLQDIGSVGMRAQSKAYMIDHYLRELEKPRKHYTVYYSTPEANDEMCHSPQGLGAFLQAYYHMKSGDWKENANPLPGPLTVKLDSLASPVSKEKVFQAVARAMEALPDYYVMPMNMSMPDVVQPHLPKRASIWLTEEELQVYTSIYADTGFQGGLNRYRTMTDETWNMEASVRVMCGKKVEVPTRFIAGEMDWGTWQVPGVIEALRSKDFVVKGGVRDEDLVIVTGAGHWVQQEKPAEVALILLEFLSRV